MRKAKGESADIQHLRSALVREGVTAYPLAMQAIAEFRHEVFEILKRVAKRRATAVSQIVGSKEFEPDGDEVDDFLDSPDTTLAVFTNTPCSFRIEVFWQDVDRPPAPVRIAAGIVCGKRATFEKVDKALQDKFGNRVTTGVEAYECYLEKAIPQEQIDKLESELGKICDAWIRMLRSVNVRKLIRSEQ
jgi:hypothetical protein